MPVMQSAGLRLRPQCKLEVPSKLRVTPVGKTSLGTESNEQMLTRVPSHGSEPPERLGYPNRSVYFGEFD